MSSGPCPGGARVGRTPSRPASSRVRSVLAPVFRAFTRDCRAFTRTRHAFTRNCCAFTRSRHAFTRNCSTFTSRQFAHTRASSTHITRRSSTIHASFAHVAPPHNTIDTSPPSVNTPVSRVSRCAAHLEARQRNSDTPKLCASRRTHRTNDRRAQPPPFHGSTGRSRRQVNSLQERIYPTGRGIKTFLVSNDSVLGSINK